MYEIAFFILAVIWLAFVAFAGLFALAMRLSQWLFDLPHEAAGYALGFVTAGLMTAVAVLAYRVV